MENKQPYGIIYMITNNVNGKIYFGQTVNKQGFKGRYSVDKTYFINHVSNTHLKNSIEKYGIENFTFYEQFDVAYSKEELDKLEDLYICIYDTLNPNKGYNKRRGGSSGKPSEESLDKYYRGDKNPFYGHKHTEEWKQRRSETHYDCKGEKHPQFGKSKSDSTRRKISKKLKENAEQGNKPHRSRKVLCVTTGEVFETIKAGAIKYNCRSSEIIKVCKGKNKTCGKLEDGTRLVWKYVE